MRTVTLSPSVTLSATFTLPPRTFQFQCLQELGGISNDTIKRMTEDFKRFSGQLEGKSCVVTLKFHPDENMVEMLARIERPDLISWMIPTEFYRAYER